jgi:hypothetical protein
VDSAPPFASIAAIPFRALTGAEAKEEPRATDAREGRQSFISRTHKRRFACLQKATEAIDYIPEPGETVYVLMTGLWDLLHGIISIIQRLPQPVEMRIATLSLSKRNAQELAALIDQGAVSRLDMLVSHFFSKHDDDIYNELVLEMHKRKQRVAVARSHCKLVTIRAADGCSLVLEGSANLRTNRNVEQLALINDAPTFQFFDRWLDEVITRYAVK